jgi:multiple sugar transport system permease protein
MDGLRLPVVAAPGEVAARPARPRLGFAQRRRLFLIMLGAPAFAYMILVALWPLGQGLYFSFTDFTLTRPNRINWVGLENYADMFVDPSARAAIVNTFVFTIAAVGLQLLLGLGLALLLLPDTRFNRVALALMLIPVTVTPLAVGLIFRAMLEPDFGILGYWARILGLSPQTGFLASENLALATLIVIDVWEWTPLMALILLAGLKSLPMDILEAAEVDGASRFQRFRLIILPMLLPAILLALIMRSMDAFKIYDSVFVTTGGGPNNATNVLMFHAAKTGLEFFQIGAASAISTFMLLCVGAMACGFVLLVRHAERRTGMR